jgi:hypothetical protein
MEYAKQCMNIREAASAIRQIRTSHAVPHVVKTLLSGHKPDVAGFRQGGAGCL